MVVPPAWSLGGEPLTTRNQHASPLSVPIYFKKLVYCVTVYFAQSARPLLFCYHEEALFACDTKLPSILFVRFTVPLFKNYIGVLLDKPLQ
jgi:hypothetical protein